MTTLLFVEHANGQIKDGTLKALSAANQMGAPVHALVAGAGTQAVAEAPPSWKASRRCCWPRMPPTITTSPSRSRR